MKVSGTGAAVGALVGCIARGSVVLLNIGNAPDANLAFALPSAGIGLLVGALAGAVGKPLLGAAVGAVLSGLVFELFMFACASVIGSFGHRSGGDFLFETMIYGLEMAIAGAVAGGVGGWAGKLAATPRDRGPVGQQLDDSRKEPPGGMDKPSEHL